MQFVPLVVWSGSKQPRSPGAEQPTQVWAVSFALGCWINTVDGLEKIFQFLVLFYFYFVVVCAVELPIGDYVVKLLVKLNGVFISIVVVDVSLRVKFSEINI